jgi:hypothetical protein
MSDATTTPETLNDGGSTPRFTTPNFLAFFDSLMSMVSWFNSKSRAASLFSFAFSVLNVIGYSYGLLSTVFLIMSLLVSLPVLFISLLQWWSSSSVLELSEYKSEMVELYSEFTNRNNKENTFKPTASFAKKTNTFFRFAMFARSTADIAFGLKGTLFALVRLFNPIQLMLFFSSMLGFTIQLLMSVVAVITIL